ncbi:MAG: hypothetical protein L0H53_06725 [Candidatus Nitrosocosmicus sp.]|nr:hypothetical protein [Candidatus Nitrosocosmicus sp.]
MTDQSESKKKKPKIRFQFEDCINYYGYILRILYEENNNTLNKTEISKRVAAKGLEDQRIDPSNYGLLSITKSKKRGNNYQGLNRREISLAAINFLKKLQLIEMQIDQDSDSRAQNFKLLDKGMEIVKFLKEMDEYLDDYFELIENIENKIPHIDDVSILERYDSSWKANEVPFYYKFRYDSLDLAEIFDKNFMNIVLLRYAKLIDSSYFGLNKQLKTIIDSLVIKVMEKKTWNMLYKYKIYEKSGEGRTILNERESNRERSKLTYETVFTSGKEGKLPFYKEIENYFNGRRIIPVLIEDEIKKMIKSYLNLLEYPKEFKMKKIDILLKNKDKLAEQYYNKYKHKEIHEDSEYDFEQLVKLIFNNHSLFLRTLKEYNIS